MKKKYTRKQILESIKYWKRQLNESHGFEDEIFTGAGPGFSDDERRARKNKFSQKGAIIIDSYENRVASRGVSDFTVNPEVADFFKKLANQCGSDWISLQVIVPPGSTDCGFDNATIVHYAENADKLDKLEEYIASNG